MCVARVNVLDVSLFRLRLEDMSRKVWSYCSKVEENTTKRSMEHFAIKLTAIIILCDIVCSVLIRNREKEDPYSPFSMQNDFKDFIRRCWSMKCKLIQTAYMLLLT